MDSIRPGTKQNLILVLIDEKRYFKKSKYKYKIQKIPGR